MSVFILLGLAWLTQACQPSDMGSYLEPGNLLIDSTDFSEGSTLPAHLRSKVEEEQQPKVLEDFFMLLDLPEDFSMDPLRKEQKIKLWKENKVLCACDPTAPVDRWTCEKGSECLRLSRPDALTAKLQFEPNGLSLGLYLLALAEERFLILDQPLGGDEKQRSLSLWFYDANSRDILPSKLISLPELPKVEQFYAKAPAKLAEAKPVWRAFAEGENLVLEASLPVEQAKCKVEFRLNKERQWQMERRCP